MEKISVLDFFLNFSNLIEEKRRGNEVYFNKGDGQKTGSLSVNIVKNVFHDKQTGIGGGLDKAIELFSNKPITSNYNKSNIELVEVHKVTINSVSKVKSSLLLDYILNVRKISDNHLHLLKQVNYTVNDKTYFTIGWQNDMEGWNTQNSLMKKVINGQGITKISNNNDTVNVFEAYFDYLAFLSDDNKPFGKNNQDLVIKDEENIRI
jgi:hypothetical protein